MDEIIFHLKVPMLGKTPNSYVYSFAYSVLIPCIIWIFLISVIYKCLRRLFNLRREVSIVLEVSNQKIQIKCLTDRTIQYLLFIGSGFLFFYAINYSNKALNFDDYIKGQLQSSTFIEENYKDPNDVTFVFPEQKRNLIYIFIESMETTYQSKEVGGAFNQNYISELTQLSDEYISFSKNDLANGGYDTIGSNWTMGGMFAQTSGLPLILPIYGNSMDEYSVFCPKVISIGDILQKEGYKNFLILGSDADFGGRSNYFKEHGDYQIFDYFTAISDGKIPQDYYTWWGFEDKKLFEYAKEQLIEISHNNTPFNYTILTADSHFEDGYVCELCQTQYGDNQYANVIACTSRQVLDFINWVQAQDFYENTTIVLSGDHTTMDIDFCNEIDTLYSRGIYNVFINSLVEPIKEKNRRFSTMDMYPSTLSSLGIKFDGGYLGLGCDLFSGNETLIEKFGIDTVNQEFGKKSNFYNENVLY
ncbi:LTA synthase family protein [Enterocloster aldenensis]|uniref:LTA synthase family protein n=1 Tax=Enterocloster aldenensis TaxID=358742 RepID=UPI0040268AF4